MEKFKKPLKIAITEKIAGLRLEANKAPMKLISASDEQPIDGLDIYDQHGLDQLVRTLMPHIEAVDEAQPVQGELSIVNYGELKLIGISGQNPMLFVFIPPQGQDLFLQVWNHLTEHPKQEADLYKQRATIPAQPDDGDFQMAAAESDEPAPIAQHDNGPLMPPPPPSEFDSAEGNFDQANHFFHGGDDAADIQHAPRADHYPELEQPPGEVSPDAGFNFSGGHPLDQDHNGDEENGADQPYSDHPFQLNDGLQPEFRNSQSTDADYATQSSDSRSYTQTEAHDQSSSGSGTGTRTSEPPIASRPQKIYFGAAVPGESLESSQAERRIDDILKVMIESGASDLHLTLNKPVCLRVDGDIQRLDGEGISEEQMESLLLPIMPRKNQQEFLDYNDTDFSYEVPGLARFRVNVFRDINGVGAVLRQIPDKIPSADDLDLPPAIRNLCELAKGLVLVTGPTGSGKSTTLASMVDLINRSRHEHILTIEDPIEFVHDQKKCLVNQREVHRHTTAFSKALRAALREDPDIILIGEMRDLETVAIAIETAETGHLVFGTLHTNTAISTIDRLIDQFPADQQEQIRIMLAESLKGVVAQTLVKRKDGGRVAAQEILIVDRAVSSLIRESNTHMIQNHMQTQKAKGNIMLNESLLNLVAKGVVNARDAYTKAVDKESFLKLLQQKGFANEVPQVS
jgi:twitching motility protein PilT